MVVMVVVIIVVVVVIMAVGVVRLGLASPARGRVAALNTTGETARADRPCLGALDFGEEAAIARCPQPGLPVFGCRRH